MKRHLTFLRVTLIPTIIIVLLVRLYLGLSRYFDADEFAHLHWTWLLTHGFIPYRDFFLYHIPVFQAFLSPLFRLPDGPLPLYAARMFVWVIFLVTTGIVYMLGKKMTDRRSARIAALLFVVFPLTLDKTIEVRPDMLMTLLFLVSLLLLLPDRVKPHRLFWSGFFLGASLMIFPKMVFAVPAWLFLTWRGHIRRGTYSAAGLSVALGTGFLIPLTLTFLWLISMGVFPLAVEAVTVWSVIVNAGKLPFSLWLALSPYPSLYIDRGGLSLPWLFGTAVWVLASAGLVQTALKNRTLAGFLLLYTGGAVVFLYLFPAPYVQYFIPLSVFACILAGHALTALARRLSVLTHAGRVENAVYLLIAALALVSFLRQTSVRIGSAADNREQLGVIRDILRISKPTDTVYDMVGSYVFRPDGYYICCHPYQEFADQLPIKLPTLRGSLIAHNTRYVIMDRTGQVFWKPKPEDLEFLTATYLPSAYPKIYIKR
ncbi:glycosyltransferase family 39 protein [Patescibacteria group bacterium]|nr:glycosyltransferase family 39 protein [Patescibacteria group bacterium]